MSTELTEEEVFRSDDDPMEAIAKLREELSEDEDSNEDENSNVEEEEEEDVIEENNTENEEESNANEDEDEDEEEDEENNEKEELLKFKANGQEFEFTKDEALNQFQTVFGQAMNFTQKMQKIAPYRKMISALEEENLSQDDLNLAIDALKGKKEAIQELLKANEIDTLDLIEDEDSASPYQPNQYGKDEVELALSEVTSKISNDKEYPITVDVVDNQWDDNSRQVLAQNPQMIEGLHYDIKTGVYDKVAPVAMKMKVLDGNAKSDLEYYLLAGEQLKQTSDKPTEDLNQPIKDAESKFRKASSEAKVKRSASSTRTRADRKGVIDYLDDNDEAFDSWYKKLQSEI